MGTLIAKWKSLGIAGKAVSVIAALILLSAIGSCGTGSNQSSETTTDQAVQEQQTSEEPQEVEAVQTPDPDGTLKVHFIDVGQGDSEFLELPNGKTMLIDAGEAEEGSNVVSYVKSLGYSDIDYLVATHPHSDHIGGIPTVLSSFDVGEVWAPKVDHTTDTYENFLDAVADEGLSITTAEAGKTVYDANGCKIDVLSPESDASYEDLNDWSAILELTFGDDSALFTGDAGSNVISGANPGDIDLLKVSHHGSETGTDAGVMTETTPEFAVISCGAGNSYGHPHQEALDALSSTKVYRTDNDGTVVATSEGDGFSFETKVTQPRAEAQAEAEAKAQEEAQAQAEAEAKAQAEAQAQAAAAAAAVSSTNASSGSGSSDVTVYITKSGSKYHVDGCRYLSKSKIPISLSEAKAKYSPCSVCNPPQ